jgi:hypothetical protein
MTGASNCSETDPSFADVIRKRRPAGNKKAIRITMRKNV